MTFHPIEEPQGSDQASAPAPSMDAQDLKRGLGIAILSARKDCCDACRALVAIREATARAMTLGGGPPEPTPAEPAGKDFPPPAPAPEPLAVQH